MIFSRSKRVKEEKKTVSDFILPPSSTLSTKGALKIVDKWVPDKNETINDTPGPGAYHIKDFSSKKGLKFSTKTVESKVKREDTTPGPGQYSLDNNVSTLIKKSFNTHNHLPLYKINNDDNNQLNDKLNPTRIQGVQTIDDNKDDDIIKPSKLSTRKDIKNAMLSLRSLAITGEIEN